LEKWFPSSEEKLFYTLTSTWILEKCRRRVMIAVTLTISTLISIMFFFIGGMLGWLAKDHFYQTQPVWTHPEMFDENGNILPDEILAVRFENSYDDEHEDEES